MAERHTLDRKNVLNNVVLKLAKKRDYGQGYVSSAKVIARFPGRNIIQKKNSRRSVPNRETFKTYQKLYFTDPVIKQAINLVCRMVVASGWKIISADDDARQRAERFFEDIDTTNILYTWIKDSKVFGTSYLEFTGDNLVPRAPQTMEIEQAENGEILGYIQLPINSTNEEDATFFEPKQIAMLKNDSFSDLPYGISDIECIQYLVTLKDFGERDVGAMLNRYVGERFDVTIGNERTTATKTRIDEVGTYFTNLQVGEDVVHGTDVQVEQLQTGHHAFDFNGYLQYILEAMGQGLGVPITSFWSGKGSTQASIEKQTEIFASYIKFLQSAVAHVINTQIIQTMIRSKEPVRFVFNNFSEEEEFIKAKTDLIWLDQRVKMRNEVRKELGLAEIPGLDDEKERGVLSDPNITGKKTPDDEKPGADNNRAEREQDVST